MSTALIIHISATQSVELMYAISSVQANCLYQFPLVIQATITKLTGIMTIELIG